MGVFGNLKSEGLEKQEDRIGGFSLLNTDVYQGKIKLAYAGKSNAGAQNVNLVLDLNGREYRETIYVSNKKGENWWINDNNKKVPLPGFTTIDELCLVTTDKPLSEQETEEKMVKVYDYEQKKEIPTSVYVLVELLDKPVRVAIYKNTESKNKLEGGVYVPTAETRETNTIEKFFHEPTGMTVNEATDGATEATFINSWLERHKDKVKDKRDRALRDGSSGIAGRPGGSEAPAASGGERKSLFGDKK